MKISVFLPVLCRSEKDYVMTEACVKLMRACTALPFELVIVETDSQRCAHLADVYLHQSLNPGVVATHNIGFALCTGEVIGHMSNDVYVTMGWLEALVECFGDALCGAATLAACELGHRKHDGIAEGIYFPCSIWRKEHAHYDENFVDTWGDADMCMAMYVKGFRMLRNYRSMAHHLWNQTIPQGPDYQTNWQANFERFKAKWATHKDSRIYKVFVEGHIV